MILFDSFPWLKTKGLSLIITRKKLSKEQVQFLKNRGMSHITPKVRKIKQISLDGECIKIWNSIKECVNHIGCHHSSIVHCCRGNKKTCKGFKWEYYDE